MIICKICGGQTKSGEPTGTFRKIEYSDSENKKGKRIKTHEMVCVACSGEMEE